MTNAERQRRYRQKLKARASGDAVADQVRGAMDRAIDALWAYHERPAPSGLRWSDIDGCTTLAECWNLGGSHNHYMFSDVSAVFYRYFAGIRPDGDIPAYRSFRVAT